MLPRRSRDDLKHEIRSIFSLTAVHLLIMAENSAPEKDATLAKDGVCYFC